MSAQTFEKRKYWKTGHTHGLEKGGCVLSKCFLHTGLLTALAVLLTPSCVHHTGNTYVNFFCSSSVFIWSLQLGGLGVLHYLLVCYKTTVSSSTQKLLEWWIIHSLCSQIQPSWLLVRLNICCHLTFWSTLLWPKVAKQQHINQKFSFSIPYATVC